MPEGHTIHRLARDLTKEFVGQRLAVSSPQGRFVEGAAEIDGRQLDRIEAFGKHLGFCWEQGPVLHVHLGLYGRFRRHQAPPPPPRGQVRLRAIGDSRAFDLNGPNQCELLALDQWQAIGERLGPDPLRADADPERLWRRLQRSRAAIGSLLLNQEVVAGVGNIYRSEVLHQLDIHPNRTGSSITRDEFDDLWSLLVELLQVGVRYNRIIIADPADVGKPRSRMSRSERLLIYKKSRCSYCESPVDSWLLAARTVFACPSCQA